MDLTIQKIIVFENIFDLLFKIIDEEGGLIDGGVIVNDCLHLLFNILQTNCSNRMLFMEEKYINKLSNYLNLNNLGIIDSSNATGLAHQAFKNIFMLLKIVRCLLTPDPSETCSVIFFQKQFSRFKFINSLFDLHCLTGSIENLLSEVCIKKDKKLNKNLKQPSFTKTFFKDNHISWFNNKRKHFKSKQIF
jgi:hypothetical protein